MALDKVDLSRMNDKKRAEKRKQKDAENPGFFSGVIARGLRGNAIDKAHAKSAEMIKQYGGDAAKSRGFMAYDKPVMKKAEGGKISEYGGKEMYKSKSAMMKHEGSESMAMERKERKMAMGGKCRGMGAATKGGNYKG